MIGKKEILDLLGGQFIQYELYEHEPIKTVSESQLLGLPHQEWATKNFFLRDKKKKNYFIITTQEKKPVELRTIREILGTSALSFASDDDLGNMLGIISGAVSPFGALNDESQKVKIYIDRLFEGNLMDAHPNDNAATMFLHADDVIQVLRQSGRIAEYIDLPSAEVVAADHAPETTSTAVEPTAASAAEPTTASSTVAASTADKILTSQCLFGGDPVRYDGKSKALEDSIYLKWKDEDRLIPVCPEVFGGLPVPRTDAQIVGDKVINRDGIDVTDAYMKGALEAVRLAKAHNVAFAVMKEKSPSCGSNQIYDGTFSGNKIPGQGLAVRLLREAGIKVFSEEEIPQAAAFLAELQRS